MQLLEPPEIAPACQKVIAYVLQIHSSAYLQPVPQILSHIFVQGLLIGHLAPIYSARPLQPCSLAMIAQNWAARMSLKGLVYLHGRSLLLSRPLHERATTASPLVSFAMHLYVGYPHWIRDKCP